MATIDEVIKAYYLHRSQGMMNPLNNLHKKYSMKTRITQPMAKDLLEGGHQERLIYERRIHYATMFDDVCKRLKGSTLLTTSYFTFEELHKDVDKLLRPIKGVGDLTIYDIALRIGYVRKNQILPKNKIYLFAGACTGANILLLNEASSSTPFNAKKIPSGSTIKPGVYDMNIFKAPLNNVPSMFLEDLLCVYHKKLKNYPIKNYSVFQQVPWYYFSIDKSFRVSSI